jgi:hypothetical protein
MPAGDWFWPPNFESTADTVAPGARVHAGAVAFRMNSPDQTVFVDRQTCRASDFQRQHDRLIETALALPRRVQRNRHNQISFSQRRAFLSPTQCFKQPARHV